MSKSEFIITAVFALGGLIAVTVAAIIALLT